MNNHRLSSILLLSVLLLTGHVTSTWAASADDAEQDTLFVCLVNGCVDAYPSSLVAQQTETSKVLSVTTIDGQVHEYPFVHILKYGVELPEMPKFTSFKFNNKFNDDVYVDVQCDITDDRLITASVPSIGRRLTPSFQLSDSVAVVYVDGVRQHSKRSRHRFDQEVDYMVCHPGHRILSLVEESEPTPIEPEPVDPVSELTEPVALTADMLSTNAPSNYGEDPANLLDGDLNTIFHSTWGTGAYEKLPADSCAYIDVQLPEALHHLQFSYTNRNSEDRYATSLRLYASTDGKAWTVIRDFYLDADGLPTAPLGTYHSPTIDLGADYTWLRFEQTSCKYRNNYLAWAEFALWKVTPLTPDEPTPDEGGDETEPESQPVTLEWKPLGRTYAVFIDWPSDRAVMTPRIDIDIEDGRMVSSKTVYLQAEIRIDGAGVFPDLKDSVAIKGRGNSSWNSTNQWAKNPYRLKFASKVKPFGLTKGKSWVLQANAQSGSMMANALGMKVARIVGAAGANHVIPVELYMNGGYRGSYIFTEKVGLAGNSIDVEDEEVAVLLELDSYYDETYRFKDYSYNLPVNVKEPDFDDPTSTSLAYNDLVEDFDRFTYAVSRRQDVSDLLDVDGFASFYLTNELVENLELMHPKSTFLYKADLSDPASKYVFGPVWDLDWAFGYENNRTYFQKDAEVTFTEARSMEKNQFWRDLRRCGEPLDRAYYRAWKRFMANGLDELLEYCDDYYTFAAPSLEHNATMWSDGRGYATAAANAKRWFSQRANYIFATLTPYDIDEEEEPDVEWVPDELPEVPDEPEIPDAVTPTTKKLTRFDVYDVRGVCVRKGATYDTLRNGLRPGLYIVNGRKMLIP